MPNPASSQSMPRDQECGSDDSASSAAQSTIDLVATPLPPAAPELVPELNMAVLPAAHPRGPGPEAGPMPQVPGYEILGLLGRGGMGVVYRARHLALDRLVALKMIRAGGLAGAADLTRFRSEAQAAARLQHPNVVQIHEVGEHDGLPFFSLELVEGGSLAERMDGTPFPPRQAAQLVRTLAQAIQAAHMSGIVHRDLKPANVLLTRAGVPKVSDFGLAKKLDDAAGLTMTGEVMGTPSYMAPEQTGQTADKVGPATDVYALGTILYELLTGRAPFKATTALDTLYQVVHQEPVPARQLQPKVPRDLETICLKCLQKEPRKRYASAEALAEDLDRFLAGEPIRARPVGVAGRFWRWCRRRPAVAALAAALALVAAAAFVSVTALWLRAENHRVRAEDNLARAEANFEMARQTVDDYYVKVANDRRLREKDLEPLRQDLLQRAAAFFEKFIEERANDPSMQADLAKAYASLSRLADATGQSTRALELDQQALGMWEKLAIAHPGVPEYRRQQAASNQHLAELYRGTTDKLNRDQLSLAETTQLQALAIQEPLASEYSNEPGYQADVARSYNSLGNLYRRLTGRSADAEAAYRKAVQGWKDLVEQHGQVPEYQAGLANAYNGLGVLFKNQGRRSEADAALTNARDAWGILVRAPNASADQMHELALTCNNLGNLYSDYMFTIPGYEAKAVDSYKQSQEIMEKLTRIHPNIPAYRAVLAGSYNNLGSMYRQLGRLAEAEVALKEAARLKERLASEHENLAEYQRSLAATYNNLGTVYRVMNQAKASEDAFRKALVIYERLAGTTGRAVEFTSLVGGTQVNLGYVAADARQEQAALDWYGKALRTLEPILQKEKRHAFTRLAISSAHEARARSLLRLGKFDPALKDWDEALAVADQDRVPMLRAGRALTQMHLGQLERALGEVEKLQGAPAGPEDDLYYECACTWALAAKAIQGATGRPPAEKEPLAALYSARAVELLEKCRAGGFFKSLNNVPLLKQDKDLDPVRHREDFKKLLGKVEAEAGTLAR
jgi:eukaryotic-like serine/threonine-protein kinase